MIVDLKKTAKETGIDDTETLMMLFGEFFNVCQADIDRLPAAIQASSYEEIRLFAHNIKGAARNLWMEEIGNASSELEALAKEAKSEGMKESYDKLVIVYNLGKNEFANMG